MNSINFEHRNTQTPLESEIIKLLERLEDYYLNFNNSIDGFTITTKHGQWSFSQFYPAV